MHRDFCSKHCTCAYTAIGDPASLNPGTGTETVLYGRGKLGSIRLETSRLPAFSFLAVAILCSVSLPKLYEYIKQVPLFYNVKKV